MKQRDKYFKDYEPYTVEKANGKGSKIKMVYIGDIHRLDASDSWRVIKKVISLIGILLYYTFSIIGGCQDIESNRGFMSIPYIVSLLTSFYCVIGVINLLVTKRDMTTFEHTEYSKQLIIGTGLAIPTMGVTSLLNIGFLLIKFLNGSLLSDNLSGYVLASICSLASCGCMLMIRVIEKKSKYIVIPNTKKNDEDNSQENSEIE